MSGSLEPLSHDAELREWAFSRHQAIVLAFGRVYGDAKDRWPDGYAIATSPVLSGAREEGGIITTRNTRYLLSGPPGNLESLLHLAQDMTANSVRRAQVAKDELILDLLQVSWGMDDATFEQVAGLPARWMWQWRNHYRAPTEKDLVRIRRIAAFHEAMRVAVYDGDYSRWWRRRWSTESVIGAVSPLEAVLAGGDKVMEDLERFLWSQVGG